MTPSSDLPPVPAVRGDGWVSLGLAVSAISAAISSFTGLRGLAVAAGWPKSLALLLPLTVDAYALTSTRLWLTSSTGERRIRRFARINAIGAICLSISGNAAWHLIAAGLLKASWPVVLGVGAVPALVMGLVAHLAVLRTGTVPVPPESDAGTTASRQSALNSPSAELVLSEPAAVRPYRTEAELLTAARQVDAAHRAAHPGKPVTRDLPRRELGIGSARASELLRQLRSVQAEG